MPAAPSIGAADLADTSRQADEIIERARAEAAKIVQEARGQAAAASGVAAAGTTTGAGRAAVAPFLAQERDFLQQLATLVQSHAESVKGMAKASRAKPPAVAAPSTPAPTPASSQPSTPADRQPSTPPATPSSPESTQPMPSVRPSAPPPGSATRDTSPPIRVEEPATASVSAGEPDDDHGQGEGGDRTLRELFWGEEA